MIDTLAFKASEILKLTKATQLFNEATYKQEFRKLSLIHHPDHGGDTEVFAQILKLYHQAEAYSTNWGYAGCLTVVAKDSVEHKFRYLSKHDFELGVIYITDTQIVYKIHECHRKPEYTKLPSFKYPKPELELKFKPILPKYDQVINLDTDLYLIHNKPQSAYLLRDVLRSTTIGLPHVAWILSRLYNIASLLEFNSYVHNDISENTVLIDPTDHSVSLVGGWWYLSKAGERLVAMPHSTYRILPPSILKDTKATSEIMNEQIHALGRQMLGNRFGSFMQLEKINKVLAEWLTNAGFESSVKEFTKWDTETLAKIFGPRKFAKWDLKKDDVYRL